MYSAQTHKPAAVASTHIVGVVALVFFLFPILWMVLTSFKHPVDAFTSVPTWSFEPTLENYKDVLIQRGFLNYLLNSILIGGIATLLTLILGVLVAYPLARY